MIKLNINKTTIHLNGTKDFFRKKKATLKDFFETTAKDYDLDTRVVKSIYNKYPFGKFYEQREKYLEGAL